MSARKRARKRARAATLDGAQAAFRMASRAEHVDPTQYPDNVPRGPATRAGRTDRLRLALRTVIRWQGGLTAAEREALRWILHPGDAPDVDAPIWPHT